VLEPADAELPEKCRKMLVIWDWPPELTEAVILALSLRVVR
jgi:hypothetical protein